MKCVKRLTADQQRLAEENLTIVERVLRFDINAIPALLVLAMRTCIKRAVSGSAMQH